MKKSKILKSLAALAVSIIAAIGCIGLVACGGGETVNSVSLNKPTLTLQVGGTETLVATTDPADATVTWSSADSSKVEVDQTGKLTAKAVTASPVVITAKAGDKSATCNVTVEEAAPAWPKTNTFNSELLLQSIVDTTVVDKLALKQDYFIQGNSFLTITENKSNVLRLNTDAFKALECKEGAISVTFTGAGTLTIGFTSTGSDVTNNISGLAVKNAAGTCLTGTVDPSGAAATLITAADDTENNGYNVGFYRVAGNSVATVTFNVTEAGTYTIWCANYGVKQDTEGNDAPTNKKATHIKTIKMVDNGPQA